MRFASVSLIRDESAVLIWLIYYVWCIFVMLSQGYSLIMGWETLAALCFCDLSRTVRLNAPLQIQPFLDTRRFPEF